jgi:hypothetical protein
VSRRHHGNQAIWTDGIVHGFVGYINTPDASLVKQRTEQLVEQYTAARQMHIRDYLHTCVIRVTSNGKVWSYAISLMVVPYIIDTPGQNQGKPGFNIRFANHYIPRDARSQGVRSLSSITSEYRPAIEWARKDIARRAKLPTTDPGALQLDVAYDVEAPQSAVSVKIPGPTGPITYTGFGAKVGHYTLAQIHEICVKSVADCIAIWAWQSAGAPPWRPSGLEVMLHSGKSALGLAFAPGTGRDTNKRTISLNATLFKLYDAHSIWRVVVHELCHHYRDEAFAKHEINPKERDELLAAIKSNMASSRRTGAWWNRLLGSHDATFVRELGRVDPKVKENAWSGLVFIEYADPSLVAEVAAKKASRQAAVKPILWDPTKGRLYAVRTRTAGLSLWWIPLEKGMWRPAKWRLGDNRLDWMINLFGSGWEQVRVTYSTSENEWYYGYTKPDNLEDFARVLEQKMGWHITALHDGKHS